MSSLVRNKGRGINGSNNVDDDEVLNDPFADFGASVTVNEDLRLAIRDEILQFDEDIATRKASVAGERKTDTRLNNELDHARNEMNNLSSRSSSQLERASFQTEIINRLMGSAAIELRGRTDEETDEEEYSENLDKMNTVESEQAGQLRNSHLANANYESRLKRDRLMKQVFALQSSIDSILARKEDLAAKLQAAADRSAEEILKEEYNSAKTRSKQKAREVEAERQRIRTMQVAIEQSRAQCGIYAHHVADQTKELDDMVRNNAAQEGALSKQIANIKSEIAAITDTTDDLMSKSAIVDTQSEQLEAQLQQYNLLCNERDSLQKALSKEDEKVSQSKETVKKLEVTLEELDRSIATVEKDLSAAQTQMQAAVAEKAANDKMEKDEFIPGEAEMAKLNTAKEELAKAITKCHDDLAYERKTNARILSDIETALDQADKKLSSIEEANESEATKLANMERVHAEARANWQKELQDIEDQERRIAEEIEAQHALSNKTASEMDNELKTRTAAAKGELEKVAAVGDIRLDIFGRMAAMLLNTSKEVMELEDDIE